VTAMASRRGTPLLRWVALARFWKTGTCDARQRLLGMLLSDGCQRSSVRLRRDPTSRRLISVCHRSQLRKRRGPPALHSPVVPSAPRRWRASDVGPRRQRMSSCGRKSWWTHDAFSWRIPQSIVGALRPDDRALAAGAERLGSGRMLLSPA
jgi:hypothetical protein